MLAVFDCIFIRFNCLSCVLIYFIQLSFMYFSSSFIGFSSVSFDCLSCVFHLSHLFFPCFIRLSSHLLDWFLLCQHRIDNIQSASTVCILEGGYSAWHKLGQNLSKVKMVLKLLKPRRGSILISSLTYSHSSRLIFQVEFHNSKKNAEIFINFFFSMCIHP